jgi:hypothetical protein
MIRSCAPFAKEATRKAQFFDGGSFYDNHNLFILAMRHFAPPRPCHLRAITQLYLGDERDADKPPCPLMDPGPPWSGDSPAMTSAATPPTITPDPSPVCLVWMTWTFVA